MYVSEMYVCNLYNFVVLFFKDGVIVFDWIDEL